MYEAQHLDKCPGCLSVPTQLRLTRGSGEARGHPHVHLPTAFLCHAKLVPALLQPAGRGYGPGSPVFFFLWKGLQVRRREGTGQRETHPYSGML